MCDGNRQHFLAFNSRNLHQVQELPVKDTKNVCFHLRVSTMLVDPSTLMMKKTKHTARVKLLYMQCLHQHGLRHTLCLLGVSAWHAIGRLANALIFQTFTHPCICQLHPLARYHCNAVMADGGPPPQSRCSFLMCQTHARLHLLLGCNALVPNWKLLLPGHARLQQVIRCCPASFMSCEMQG